MPMWEPLCKPASRRLRVRECAASRHCTACVLPATTASADAASRAGCEVSGACIRMLSAREAIAACWLCTSAAHASAWPALPRRVVWRHCAACKGCCKALGHVHKHQFSAAGACRSYGSWSATPMHHCQYQERAAWKHLACGRMRTCPAAVDAAMP